MPHMAESTVREPNIFDLHSATTRALGELAATLPRPDQFTGESLHSAIVDTYREAVLEEPEIELLAYTMQTDLAPERDARGYIIIDGVPLGDDDTNMAVPTALCSLAGQPFFMAKRLGFWQDLGVKLDAVPYRFAGTGVNPFHIDGVNTTRPPDYFTFYGLRTDPAGGGMSMVSNLQDMVEQLTPEERKYLQEPRYTEGRFEDMQGVGEEYNPFPVLEMAASGLWWVRYTGKMLPEMPESYDKELFTKIGDILYKNRETFMLKPGQLLITRQLLLAHGREELGPNQDQIPAHRRRYLRQSYIHAEA